MAFTLEDNLAQAAHLADLTPEQTRLALAVGLFAEDRLTLAQAADLAGLDRLDFQRHLAALGIPLHYGQEGFDMDLAELACRGKPLVRLEPAKELPEDIWVRRANHIEQHGTLLPGEPDFELPEPLPSNWSDPLA